MATCSRPISNSNFDGISFDNLNTNGGAFNFAGAQGVGGHGEEHGVVQSQIENSNFNDIHFNDLNTNGGAFNVAGAQGVGGHGDEHGAVQSADL